MRGIDTTQSAMFSYISPEQRVPKDHPLRQIWGLCDVALRAPSRQFDRMYSDMGRPSIAPEKLLRALLLQIPYTMRSERMLMEKLDYNLLFRWSGIEYGRRRMGPRQYTATRSGPRLLD